MNRRAIALLSVGHFLIDLCQGIVPALVPFLVEGRGFSKTAAAGLVFAISATSSVVQPVFGQLADRLAMSWLLPASIFLTGSALAVGSQAASYSVVLAAFGLSGLGVAAFHPEAARKAHLASGRRRTTGMSFFSIGGGLGFALAPAITLALVQTRGIGGLLWLLVPTGTIAALVAGRSRPAADPDPDSALPAARAQAQAHAETSGTIALEGVDDWRAFRILSGATVSRSIVFYGINTFLALYFMSRWRLTAAEASPAIIVFLGTSIFGTLLGGWMADRFGRRAVIRAGFVGAAVCLAGFLQVTDRRLALAALVPLAVFLFLPTSVLVVLGQEYLPHRVGVASGVTLGLAVSVGGMCAPLLGLLGQHRGMDVLFAVLLVVLTLAAVQAFALPPVGAARTTTPRGRIRGRAPRWLWILWLVVLAGLAATLGGIAAQRWAQAELQRVEQAVEEGRIRSARGRLSWLGMLGLGGTEADYWRGACAEAEGRVEDALAIWARIPLGAARSSEATLRRARLAFDQGRFAAAEEALEHARFPGGTRAAELREGLWQQVALFTGRTDDQQRSIRREWPHARQEAGVLRKHWRVNDARSYPAGTLQSRLEQAGRMAPDDDRVWLGRAHLAIRTARFDEAEDWLQKCRERRAHDPAVWRARLEWATASGRRDEAVAAMRHLETSDIEPGRILALRAWLAAQLGDPCAEEAAWSGLSASVPGHSQAVVRLTELAVQAGRTEQVDGLRRRKADLDRATDRYRALLDDHAPTGGYDELARLAEALGRWFEARGWWTLVGREPARAGQARAALARLDAAERALAAAETSGRPRTVADALADLIPRGLRRRAESPGSARWAVPIFRDDAAPSGLRFVYENDSTPLWRLPEAMGGGVGLIDFDGDGWLDVYAVQGGQLPNQAPPPPSPLGDRLYRNRGDGTFEDVTSAAGLTAFPGGYGHGVAVADYDNDGRPDLFVTRWWSYALYRNRGDGTFEDVTSAAGLSDGRDWPTSAAFADLDGDGDLDLYVCHYADWDPRQSPRCPHPVDPQRLISCGPRTFAAEPDHIFRNDGGHFIDVTGPAGIQSADRDGRGLGVVAADLDDDGRVDLFVANDLTANFLFRNRGGFRFEETAEKSGVATNAAGGYLAGMGVACGDLDGDGRLDLAVTNFYGESTTFYQGLGAGQFVDHTAGVGLAAPSRYLLGFGAAFFDANNDGFLDLATANGHVNDLRPHIPYAMPAQLLLGDSSGRLTDVSSRAGAAWQRPRLGRGLAVGDLDNDGRIDLLIVAQGQPLAYFHNQGPTGHFVTIQLEGSPPGSPRDALGARVTLTAGGRRQVAHRFGGGSFLSASDHRLHFGLGTASRVEAIEVRWPSGRLDRYTDLAADAAYLLREGQSRAWPLAGWWRSSEP